MGKTEWPSEKKLERLRDKGVVPLSFFSLSCATLIFVLFMFYGSADLLRQIFIDYREWFLTDSLDTEILLKNFRPLFERFFFLLPAGFLLIVLGCALLQTRFLIKPGLAAFNFMRLNAFEGGVPSAPFKRTGTGLVRICVIAIVTALIFRITVPALISLYNSSSPGELLLSSLESGVPILAALLLLSGILAWFWHRFFFLYQHRMTKKEVEQEAHER